MPIDNIKPGWKNIEEKLSSQKVIEEFGNKTKKVFETQYPPVGFKMHTNKALVKKILIGAGTLIMAWALNYGVSSAIAESYYQKKRNHCYESNFDYKKVEEWDKQIKYWKTNALFPYANELELFKEEEKTGSLDYATFPDKSIRDLDNFKQYSDDIMSMVADSMKMKIKKSIARPRVVRSDEITLQEFNKLFNLEEGYSFREMFPIYSSQENLIVVLTDSKLDSLAHQYVHYFQVKYRQESLDYRVYFDSLEYEAVQIQEGFRKLHLKTGT